MTNDIKADVLATVAALALFGGSYLLTKRDQGAMLSYLVRSLTSLLELFLGWVLVGYVLFGHYSGGAAIIGGSLLCGGWLVAPNHWSVAGRGKIAQLLTVMSGFCVGFVLTRPTPASDSAWVLLLMALLLIGFSLYMWAEDRYRFVPSA